MDIVTINENTPFRFIMRKGTNLERLNCILAEGELAYTTDTKRLFVGDGTTMGGNPINNIVLYSGSLDSIPTSGLVKGDIVYNNNSISVFNVNRWLTYTVNPDSFLIG